MRKRDGKGPVEGRGGGRMGGQKKGGPGGNCVCPDCGFKEAQERGNPCYKMDCPECGSKMIRE